MSEQKLPRTAYELKEGESYAPLVRDESVVEPIHVILNWAPPAS